MALRRGVWRWLQMAVGLLGLGVAACDDGTVITRVMVERDAASLLVLSGPQGMATEVHGAPFPDATPDWVAANLRAPATMSTGIRFRAVGIGMARDGARLVLVFNRRDAPDPVRDCARQAEAPVGSPQSEGFTVTATICNAQALMATAHMEARKTRLGDNAEFTRVMRLLLMQIAMRPG